MLKKLICVATVFTLSACTLPHIPLLNSSKQDDVVIDLKEEQIDQKSYAVAYSAASRTYAERVHSDFDVDAFAKGVNDWYRQIISRNTVNQLKTKLYDGRGYNSDEYAYYSGVIFAADLQQNFNRLSMHCWSHIDPQSMTQGIYDAMRDLQQNKVRSEDEPYLAQGSDRLLALCR